MTEQRGKLGLLPMISLVVGTVLGAGAFMKPPIILHYAGGADLALLAWLFGGVLSILGGLTLAELSSLFPRTGGIYVYLKEVYGEKTAYFYGWTVMVIYAPAALGTLCIYFGSFFVNVFALNEKITLVVAVLAIFLITLSNIISTSWSGKLQLIITACKVIPIVLLVIFGLLIGNESVITQIISQKMVLTGEVKLGLAVLSVLFAYDGWAMAAAMGGEAKNSSRNIPRAIIIGILILITCYLLVNIAFLNTLDVGSIIRLGEASALVLSTKLFGVFGGKILSVLILLALLGGVNGVAMTSSRIIYSMAGEKQLPAYQLLGKMSKFGTPAYSLGFVFLLTTVYALFLDAEMMSELAMFSIWCFYLLSFIAVFMARKKFPDLKRDYKVPLYPVVPIIAIIGVLFVLGSTILATPIHALISLIITICGLVLFWLNKKYQGRNNG